MLRSLTLKLIIAFLLVAVTGTLLVALYVNQRTQREFDQFVLNRYEADVIDELTQYYQQFGSWAEIGAIVLRGRHPREMAPANITLVDAERQVIYSPSYAVGQQLTQQETGQTVPVTVDGQTVGAVIFPNREPSGLAPGSPEAIFLASMRRAIVLGSSGAVLVALVLGIVLARTLTEPLHELTEATRALAQGALGKQVPVRSHDELGELSMSFNQMSTDLARSVHQRRQMTADIAHDLRTPLSVILGYTEALSDGKIPGSHEIYGVMHGEAQHLQRLIEDLRLLSLADAGELSLNRQPTSPLSILKRTAASHTVNAHENEIELQVDAPVSLPNVSVDLDRMTQVMGNLVSNAIRHTSQGGRIQLSASVDVDTVHLQVQDTGEGIAPENLPHVFDRFYRGDPTRTHGGESGLGLAIARSLVEAHGGTITVDSTVGEGTRFTVSLPAAV